MPHGIEVVVRRENRVASITARVRQANVVLGSACVAPQGGEVDVVFHGDVGSLQTGRVARPGEPVGGLLIVWFLFSIAGVASEMSMVLSRLGERGAAD